VRKLPGSWPTGTRPRVLTVPCCLQVYQTLCMALASSALGAYLHVVWNVGGMLTMLGCMGSVAWLFSVPVYEEVRLSLFESILIAPALEV
jgi:hypothetical protein